MPAKGTQEAWSLLTELLEKTMKELLRRKADSAQTLLAEFIQRSDAAGYGSLSRAARAEAAFFKKAVLPNWDEEASATLGFSLGALFEKMQLDAPGPQFDSGLEEILSFLDVFEEPVREDTPDRSQEIEDLPEVERVAAVERRLQTGFSSEHPRENAPVHVQQFETMTLTPAWPDNADRMRRGDPDLAGERGSSDYVMDRADWYKELLREDPSSILFCELAEELCSRGLWQEAVKILRGGLLYHPRHIRGYALLGWALWEFGSAEEAEKALTLARSEIEKCAVVYRVLGEISTHQGAMPEANRLETIYSMIKEGMVEPEDQWLPPPVSPEEDQPDIEWVAEELSLETQANEEKESGPLSFLYALLDRVREVRVSETQDLKLFRGSDRKALEQLIHVHSGSV